ncbi:unnamed protein product [Paramecium sonneborni]|uniref:Uncharacterized protein n=1 Tax=Paramecium sonneborni TaxID=65129 RepID=A0A8S1KG13_9CILI|nr:unnamed protein product [Paramecium sonneborni]
MNKKFQQNFYPYLQWIEICQKRNFKSIGNKTLQK